MSIVDRSVTSLAPEQVTVRNDFVAAVAGALFVPHAVPGGKTGATAAACLSRGQRVFTVEDSSNDHLLAAGAIDLTVWTDAPRAIGPETEFGRH